MATCFGFTRSLTPEECAMFKLCVAVFALMAGAAIPGSVIAAERGRDGVRSADRIEVGAARRHARRSQHRDGGVRSSQPPQKESLPEKESWAGYRTDFAGNSYFYYKPGAGSPFGPGQGLRPPYPN
jgi:hypothetical protein